MLAEAGARTGEKSQLWIKADPPTIERLASMGFNIEARFDSLATVSIDTDRIGDLQQVAGVKAVRRATRLELHNDIALQLSRATTLPDEDIVAGDDTLSHTGRGVVVGVIDTGFDFSHINFKDRDGNSRIAAVYLPDDSTGVAPTVDGNALPGSAYYGNDIQELTTDNPNMSHGTHTSGTAAGSYADGGYRGVAPGSTLVLCGMPENRLTDANIAASISFIFDYADRHNMPAVINMSLGSCDGAHDGSSPLCQVIDRMSGNGKICVVSAGNQGHNPCHWHHTFKNGNDSLATFLIKVVGGDRYSGYASTWASTDKPHDVFVEIMDIEADTVCFRTRLDTLPVDDDNVAILSSDDNGQWARYIDGYIAFYGEIADNGRFNSIVEFSVIPAEYPKYALGVIYHADSGDRLWSWCSGTCFVDWSKRGWTRGTPQYTISDLATAKKVISVGAYCSKKSTPKYDGTVINYSRCNPGDIAYFSSYGPDATGRKKPDITAPGFALVSSANRYDSVSNIMRRHAFDVELDGISYPYGTEYGTSMSTPVVAGAIALMLQANPNLNADDVLEIFAETAVRDNYITESNAQRWGYGKLDVTAALKKAIQSNYDVNDDGAVNVGDVAAIYYCILGIGDDEKQARADVNHDRTVNVGDVSDLYRFIISQQPQ